MTDDRMADIRLLDDRGIEVPFVIRRERGEETVMVEKPVPTERIAGQVEPGEWIELIERISGDMQIRPNAVTIRTPLRNFEKDVDIEAGPDGVQWESLVSAAVIYDYSRYTDLRRVQIEFPETEHRYFRIRIRNISELKESPLMQISRGVSDSETVDAVQKTITREDFRVESLQFSSRCSETRPTDDLKRTFQVTDFTLNRDETTHQTVLEAVTHRVPVTGLGIVTPDDNFSRRVRVEGLSAGKWTRVAKGSLASIRIAGTRRDQLHIDLPGESRLERLRLIIEDGDNQPIGISGFDIQYNSRQIAFLQQSGRQYLVFYGSSTAEPPVYDLDEVIATASSNAIVRAMTGPGTANPDYSGSTEIASFLRGGLLIWIAGAMAVGVLGWLIVVAMKKTEAMS